MASRKSAARGRSGAAAAERDHLVGGVVADVGAAAKPYARSRAPVGDDRFLVAAEVDVIGGNVRGAAEPYLGGLADVPVGSDVEHQPVDAIMMLANLLDQQLGAGEVRLQRRAEQMRKHGQVERKGRLGEPRLERRGIAPHQPVERAAHRRLAAVAKHVGRHWTMRDFDAGAVQSSQQEATVAVAHDKLVPRRRRQSRDGGLGNAVRPIAATRQPDGVDAGIGRDFAEGREPVLVGAGEMAVAEEALRVDDQLAIAAARNHRLHPLGGGGVQPAARRDNRDPLHLFPFVFSPPGNRARAMSDSTFFCGIGGSGMLPLASIVRAGGGRVAGSDRSLDAGRLAPKFDYLRSLGIGLFPQDGSGLQPGMTLVTSAAVEPTVPDMVRARDLGLPHLTRPQLLAQLLNAARRSVAVGGTSGKSTVTGMIGWILHACHRQPTVMNGAVMKNFVTPSAPFASALVGDPELFVSEVDESDGSIALYRPEVAVLTNISLDHKEMAELRELFAGFLNASRKAVLNLDDPEARILADMVSGARCLGYGFDSPGAAFLGRNLDLHADGVRFSVDHQGERHGVALRVPGRHNASNALGALAVTHALGVPLAEAAAALGRFEGLKRRLETVGSAAGVTVIDDFAHNPDKIDATLATLRAHPGRLLIMFQPHGYGPLAKMGEQLARSLSGGMARGDRLYLPDPVYQGGTTERSRGSDWLAARVREEGALAEHLPERAAIGDALLAEAREGDRILVMGARDDTLSEFAADLVRRLEARN